MSLPQSYFEPTVGDAARAPQRRLLLLSYHFPPDGAVGGLRWEQMARFFSANGWGVDVVMRDLTRLASPDARRLQRLPDDVRVYSATEIDPWLARMEADMLRVARSLRPRRANAALSGGEGAVGLTTGRARKKSWLIHTHAALVHVERERAWGRAAVEIGVELGRANRYDVVVSSGPPHMVHDAGRTLSLRLGVPFVMDLRDPWSAFELEHGDSTSRVWFAIARHYERRAIQTASLVVMNTDLARDEMRRLYPAAADRIITVGNGSDDEPIPAVENDWTIRRSLRRHHLSGSRSGPVLSRRRHGRATPASDSVAVRRGVHRRSARVRRPERSYDGRRGRLWRVSDAR